jgi:hypothetical protein
MSWSARYRDRATRHTLTAMRREANGAHSCSRIAMHHAQTYARLAATAERWEQMANTPLVKRPGGYPGDPFNSQPPVKHENF